MPWWFCLASFIAASCGSGVSPRLPSAIGPGRPSHGGLGVLLGLVYRALGRAPTMPWWFCWARLSRRLVGAASRRDCHPQSGRDAPSHGGLGGSARPRLSRAGARSYDALVVLLGLVSRGVLWERRLAATATATCNRAGTRPPMGGLGVLLGLVYRALGRAPTMPWWFCFGLVYRGVLWERRLAATATCNRAGTRPPMGGLGVLLGLVYRALGRAPTMPWGSVFIRRSARGAACPDAAPGTPSCRHTAR